MTEPCKYIFILSPMNSVSIVELFPVTYGRFVKNVPTYFEFITQEQFNKVIAFHQNINNHCPMLRQCWLSTGIDLWEDMSDFVIYDTKEEALAAGNKLKSENPE